MKKKFVPVALLAILMSITSCNGGLSSIASTSSSSTNNSSSSLTESSSNQSSEESIGQSSISESTSESVSSSQSSSIVSSENSSNISSENSSSTSTSVSIDSKYSTLSSVSSMAVNTSVTCLAAVTGTDGSGLYIQDDTASFYAYYGSAGMGDVAIGDLIEITGTVAEYGGNKQISNYKTVKKGTKAANIITANSVSDIANNKYAPISTTVTLTSNFSSLAASDIILAASLNGTAINLFVKKYNSEYQKIYDAMKDLKTGATLKLTGSFANAYNNVPQISITALKQIEFQAPQTEAEIIEYAKGQISELLSLDNKTISSNLTLLTSAKYNVTYAYTSSNPTNLSNSGVVTRPLEGEADALANLTIDILISGVSKFTTTIKLTVKAISPAGEVGDLPSYYTSIDTTKVGDNLRTDLENLLNSKWKGSISYSQAKTILKTADADPDHSGSILSFYTGQSTTSWNREHVWPASRGVEETNAGSDPHMLRACSSSENSARGNRYFGETAEGIDGNDGVGIYDPGTAASGAKLQYRGAAARIIFYTATKWWHKPSNGASTLELDDTPRTSPSRSGSSMGKVSDLLDWCLTYDVNDIETRRNEYLVGVTGARNPFIDSPLLAAKIWGNFNDATRAVCEKHNISYL